IHDLADRHAGEVELHRERFGEQPRIAPCDAGPAAGADPDLDDTERFQRAQRVTRHDPAHPEALRKVLFGAEKVAWPHLLGEQRLAHPGDDSRRQRRAAKGEDFAKLDRRMWQPHARSSNPKHNKDNIFRRCRQAPDFPAEIAGCSPWDGGGADWQGARATKEGKPRAMPGAFRSNPPIKSVKPT